MSTALEKHDGKVCIGGRNITNLRFADDIDVPDEEEQELEALVESFYEICTRYKMGISTEKLKLMTNNENGIQREIKMKGQELGTEPQELSLNTGYELQSTSCRIKPHNVGLQKKEIQYHSSV